MLRVSDLHLDQGETEGSTALLEVAQKIPLEHLALIDPRAASVLHRLVLEPASNLLRQLVDEDNKAWHISADYDCSNNDNVECWRNGDSMNTYSIGIEHGGYANQSSWDSGLIGRSAELACGITQRHPIERDSHHIVAHGQLQPWSRIDPGPNWPWADYLNRIDDACGGGPPVTGGGSSFIIDSNNGYNDTNSYYIETSSNWTGSANVSGYWNTGYWVGPTDTVSDSASFWFYTSQTTCYQVDAWWPAAWDRYDAATFLGWDQNNNEVGRAVVNQRVNGSQWNHLGEWTFGSGWNRVLLSRWASPGQYVIADAVQLTECSGGGGGGLTLFGANPGAAGSSNTWDVSGATPGETVAVVLGDTGSPTNVPGCLGATVPFQVVALIGTDTANASGDASVQRSVPAHLSGTDWKMAAVDLGACEVSATLNQDF